MTLDDADEHWAAEHGFLTENPLIAEIEHAASMLRETPEIGVPFPKARIARDVRRLLLRTGWHVYYSFDRERNVVMILMIWYASRGSEPPL